MYFGLETRMPYAVANTLRPMMFNKPSRPWFGQLQFYGQQALTHGWVIARISFLFKLIEKTLLNLTGTARPWHSFVAGCAAGYLIMVRDTREVSLKTQINMAIGVRTLYALASYLVRHGKVPFIDNTPAGYARGKGIYTTLLWGLVMWHWRNHAGVKGEMARAQVNQMNFIYNAGDAPGKAGWMSSNYMLWAAVCVLLQKL